MFVKFLWLFIYLDGELIRNTEAQTYWSKIKLLHGYQDFPGDSETYDILKDTCLEQFDLYVLGHLNRAAEKTAGYTVLENEREV